ncbi:MAG: hypothetical protein J7L66_03370 [Anaerolineaceae bacterium]|nr:hypothetical protein [Anaerolineaceae bacterium]
MKKAAILGAGVMGSAIAWPLADNGYSVNLIGTHLDGEIIRSCKEKRVHPRLKRKIPETVMPFYIEELESALEGAEFIVSGVNSSGVRWLGRTLAPYIQAGDRIISITKGLEADAAGNLVILPEVLRQELPPAVRKKVSIAAVGGPCIAAELAGRRQSCVYFGADEAKTAQKFADIFRTNYYHVRATNDIAGLEIAVALKNAYALGVGLADGIFEKSGGVDAAGAHMHNLSAALFARACIEIYHLLKVRGLNTDFAYSLPGAGDLFVTSQAGRSVTLGKLLGMGKTYPEAARALTGETLEAAMVIQQMGKALPVIFEKGLLRKKQLPFMRLLVDVVIHGKPVKIDLDNFFENIEL